MIDVAAVKEEMLLAAANAAAEYVTRHYGGADAGACGFAWVTIYPEHKGNTRAGKAERAVIRDLGFETDWTGKSFQLWNPSKWGGQNVDTKEAGARAAVAVLKKYGFKASAGSRLD
jgi:hypothetical protein